MAENAVHTRVQYVGFVEVVGWPVRVRRIA